MKKKSFVFISGAVEGIVDEAVLTRLVQYTGATLWPVHGKNGKSHLLQKLNGYNNAANFNPWIVLMDLNHQEDCAPPMRASHIPNPAPKMCFRIAVREIEAWLLADREHFARFLSIPVTGVPSNPDNLDDPKQTVVNLAKRSRRREIREDFVPRQGSGRKIGPAYSSRLIEFAEKHWKPDLASKHSDSLRRCRKRIRELVKKSK